MSRYPIPDAALDTDIAILGKKGKGKTHTAKTIVERLLDTKRRPLILDPVGVWYGLRTLADGKHAGYPIAIFGGQHADRPLTPNMGHELGRILAKEHLPAIVDMGGMRKGEQHRLVGDLLEELFILNRSPLWLVLEEAHHFAPQKPMDGDSNRTLGEVIRIATQARSRGIRLISVTQRPARLHKDVLTQLSVLVAHGVTSPQDRDAVKDWVEGNGDRNLAKEVYATIGKLGRGEAWVWAPDFDTLERVTFPPIKTLDTSATPTGRRNAAAPKTIAEVDLSALDAQLKASAKEAAANDPKALKAEIARLNAELKKAPKNITGTAPDPAAIAKAEERGFEQAKKKLAAAADAEVKRNRDELLKKFSDAVLPLKDLLKEELTARVKPQLAKALTFTPSGSPASVTAHTPPRRATVPAATARAKPSLVASGDGTFDRPQTKVLQALAAWRALGHDQPSREMVAAIAGYKPSTGNFNNIIGGLVTAGAIGKPAPGRLSLLTDGIAVIDPDQARDILLATLDNPQKRVVAALVDQGERTREEVATDAGYQPSTGNYNNILGSLNTIGVTYKPAPGRIALTDWAQELLSGHSLQVAA